MFKKKSPTIFSDPTTGYLAISFCAPDRVQCFNCPRNVLDRIQLGIAAVQKSVREGSDSAPVDSDKKGNRSAADTVFTTKQYGSVTEFCVGGFPFVAEPTVSGKNIATLVAMRILEEIALLQYDFVTATNMTSGAGTNATWVFAQVRKQQKVYQRIPKLTERPHIVVIEPSGYDTLRIIGSDADIAAAMDTAVARAWPHGATSTEKSQCGSTRVDTMKLRNSPWYTHRKETDPVLVQSKQFLLGIIGQMAKLRYTLVCSTNIFGSTDSLMFMIDTSLPQYTEDNYCMVSLDTSNCVRMINCSEVLITPMREVLKTMGKLMVESDGGNNAATHYEFAIDDRPWIDMPMKSDVPARRLVAKIVEMMATFGCHLVESLDLSKHEYDRSMLLFHHENATIGRTRDTLECGTVAMAYHNVLTLVDLPSDVAETVTENFGVLYTPGIASESKGPTEANGTTTSIVLEGFPWTSMCEIDRLNALVALVGSMQELQSKGWEVLASIDIAGRTNPECNENGPHSLLFVKVM
eukprot:GEMP01013494.1.p1 GENE.GEMP01013494.1~~GEMP01013494.1.p1  ORF type:complete len:522 (+),score=145.80 GEMP01013494.1:274-1839(+)